MFTHEARGSSPTPGIITGALPVDHARPKGRRWLGVGEDGRWIVWSSVKVACGCGGGRESDGVQ